MPNAKGLITMSDTHILVVGQSEFTREGLRYLLSERGFSVRCTGPETICSGLRIRPRDGLHLTIIDNSVPDPLPLCRSLLEEDPVGAIALISGNRDRAFFAEVCELETVSLIDDAASCDAFEAYLRLIATGELILPYAMIESAIAARSVAPRDTVSPDTLLSTREWDVAHSLVAGSSNKLIARELHLSEATVKVHVKSILRKLHLANRTQVAIWASCTRTATLGVIAASVCAIGAAEPLALVA